MSGGIYDCKIVCEVGGGQGSIEYTYASMCWDGCKGKGSICGSGGSSSGQTEPTVPQGPYKDKKASVPGTIEAENYDVGGNGFAYNDDDDDNRGDAKFRDD